MGNINSLRKLITLERKDQPLKYATHITLHQSFKLPLVHIFHQKLQSILIVSRMLIFNFKGSSIGDTEYKLTVTNCHMAFDLASCYVITRFRRFQWL